jgi:hypothetical protein
MRDVEREKGTRPLPQIDGDVNAGSSSGANELMMALEREKQKGDKSYVALKSLNYLGQIFRRM